MARRALTLWVLGLALMSALLVLATPAANAGGTEMQFLAQYEPLGGPTSPPPIGPGVAVPVDPDFSIPVRGTSRGIVAFMEQQLAGVRFYVQYASLRAGARGSAVANMTGSPVDVIVG